MRILRFGIAALAAGCLLAFAASSVAAPAAVPAAAPHGTPVAASKVSTTSKSAAASKAATASKTATASKSSTAPPQGYLLDFTLPTFGKSGCLVCHGDPKLVVSKGSANRSFWIDQKRYEASAHGTIMCTGCHIDYGYKAPHGQKNSAWRETAKQACKNCHQNAFRVYSLGSHAVRPLAGGKPDPKAAVKPLCGDCHGGHYMPTLKDNPAGQAEVQASAQQMCGKPGCHADRWEAYSDYYHGAAYKNGAPDAPACWQCHGTHAVFPSKNLQSPTNVVNLGETCAASGECHEGASESYAEYVPLIHKKADVLKSNPVYATLTGIIGAVTGLFGVR